MSEIIFNGESHSMYVNKQNGLKKTAVVFIQIGFNLRRVRLCINNDLYNLLEQAMPHIKAIVEGEE